MDNQSIQYVFSELVATKYGIPPNVHLLQLPTVSRWYCALLLPARATYYREFDMDIFDLLHNVLPAGDCLLGSPF